MAAVTICSDLSDVSHLQISVAAVFVCVCVCVCARARVRVRACMHVFPHLALCVSFPFFDHVDSSSQCVNCL